MLTKEQAREFGYASNVDDYVVVIAKGGKGTHYENTRNVQMFSIVQDIAYINARTSTEEAVDFAVSRGWQVIAVVEYHGEVVPRESAEMVYSSKVVVGLPERQENASED